MKTKQEIFDRVVRGLAAQDWRRSVETDIDGQGAGACVYRSSDGAKCAAGQLIDDASYTPGLEFNQVNTSPVQQALILSGVPSFLLRFVMQLQTEHDASTDQRLRDDFLRLAEKEGLQWPKGC